VQLRVHVSSLVSLARAQLESLLPRHSLSQLEVELSDGRRQGCKVPAQVFGSLEASAMEPGKEHACWVSCTRVEVQKEDRALHELVKRH
jgi:hypothetical protein